MESVGSMARASLRSGFSARITTKSAVPPAALRVAGWHNYSLFLRPDGLVFGYFETEESLSAAQAQMATTEINTRWQEFMSPFVDANARPDETFIELEEYFHLD